MIDLSPPLPSPSPESQPFWQAARQGHLVLPRCNACDQGYFYYPRATCPNCLSPDLSWEELSGRAALFTYTVAQTPTHPGFAQKEPLIIAIVELEEGPRMSTNILACPPEKLTIGMPLVAVFEPVDDAIALVKFRPA